jgi:hypothetical protein
MAIKGNFLRITNGKAVYPFPAFLFSFCVSINCPPPARSSRWFRRCIEMVQENIGGFVVVIGAESLHVEEPSL